jgi:hypothetical protein
MEIHSKWLNLLWHDNHGFNLKEPSIIFIAEAIGESGYS